MKLQYSIKSFIFDTSFLISLLDIDDINHKKALDKISDLEI
jgi:predicted nucleic acid-binding protein